MIEIPLTQGKVAVVSNEDMWITQFKWCAAWKGYTWVAVRRIVKDQNVLMHRMIMQEPDCDVDHKDGNGLNNTRENLRLATRSQNLANTKPRGVSRFKGVFWEKNLGKWRACIRRDGKRYHLGVFVNEEDAARAYDVAARELHDGFAYLNFP